MPLGAFRLNGLGRFVDTEITRPLPITVIGPAKKSTAVAPQIGTASLYPGGGGRLEVPCQLPQTGDWTIEYWARNGSRSANAGHWQLINGSHYIRAYTTTQQFGTIQIVATDAGGTVQFSENTGPFLPDNTWNHVALVRDGNDFRIYDNGVLKISWTSSVELPSLGVFQVGAYGGANYRGYLDEFRVSSVARYSSNYTVPTSAFTNDADTLLLLHFDGTDGSTDFVDDNS